MSLKVLIVALVLCIQNYSLSQDILLTHKVVDDKLHLKWLPSSIESFKSLLRKPTKISWIALDRNADTTNADFSKANSKSFKPLKITYDSLSKLDDSLYIIGEVFLLDSEMGEKVASQNFITALYQDILDKKIASAINNSFSIEKINASKKKYLIKIENSGFKTQFFLIDPKVVSSKTVNPSVLLDKKKVLVNWDVKDLDTDFSAYNLYKREGEKGDFIKLNKLPIVPFLSSGEVNPNLKNYTDSKVKKGKTYYYYLSALDYFADEVFKSKFLKIHIPLSVDAKVEIKKIEAEKNNRNIEVAIFPTDSTVEISASKIALFRSDSMYYGYKPIQVDVLKTPVSNYKFQVPNYKTGDRFFYSVALISEDNDTVTSSPYYFFTLDQDPPDKITDFKSTIDSLGIVKLSWVKPIDNDIKGYRVFRANTQKEEFIELTTKLDVFDKFTDTLSLNSLTNDIYYFVRVVDNNFNNSKNSDTLLVIKPDTIAPIAGVLKDFISSKEGITLKWANSTSNDLKSQYILRLSNGKADTVFAWIDKTNSYLDTSVSSGQMYEYQLLSIDKSKNISKSNPININYELGYRDAIKQFTGEVNRTNKSIILKWDYPVKKDVYSYQIFKAKEDGKFTLYKTLEVNDDFKNTFEDKDLKLNSVFKYKIKAVLNSGISTALSKEIVVNY